MVTDNTPEGRGRLTEAEIEDTESFHPKCFFGDRKRAVLTERDRGLLWGDLELQGQQLRDAKYRIRQRVINGIYDMEAIANMLEYEELEKVVNRLEDREHIVEGEEPRHETDNAISWIFKLLFKIQLLHSENKGTNFISDLEDNLEEEFQDCYGPGELSISYELFEPDERQEELAKKIVTGKADIDEYNYFVINYKPKVLLDLMGERDIDSFVISRENGPDFNIDTERLVNKY